MNGRMLTVACTFGFAASLSAGCSSDDDGAGGGGTSTIALEDVGPLLAEVQCGAFERCFGSLYDLFLAGEDCEARTAAAFRDDVKNIQAALDAGNASYDGTKVQGCLDAFKTVSCADLGVTELAACKAVVVGTIAEGGDCTSTPECVVDTFCKHANTCPGTCTVKGGVGAVCRSDSECGDGVVCNEKSGTCVVPAGPGAACGGAGGTDCSLGLFCSGEDEETGKAGTCATIDEVFSAKAGDSCGLDTVLCTSDLSCAVVGVSAAGAQFECVPKAGSGAECKIGFPEVCPVGEYCDAPNLTTGDVNGTCKPVAGAGEPCTQPQFGDLRCAPNLRCDDGTCRPLQPLGGTCTDNAVCHSENCVGGSCRHKESCE